MASSNTGVDACTTLLAIKAALFAPGLNHTERRVVGALIEHFNRETGRCDPGLERLATLLGKNVRTIERALEGLVCARLIRVFRHGGKSNRNSYELIWERFAQLENEWRGKFEAAARERRTFLAQATRRPSRPTGDRNVHQTDSNNLLNQTYSWPGRRGGPRPSSREASRSEAHRRLSEQLRTRAPSVADYAKVVEIDDEIWTSAVEAECKRRGAGARILSDWLDRRDAGA